MKAIVGGLTGLLFLTSLCSAQTLDEMRITVGGYLLASTGPETPAGVWRVSGRLTIGTATVGLFSMKNCGQFSLTVPPNSFENESSAAWRVEVTPTRIENGTVTFRLRWTRAGGVNARLAPASEDVEVTLKAGESRPVDSVPVDPTGATSDGRPCTTRAASLRVLVDYPEMDRRLVAAEVWLVERTAAGKEQSQLQSVRGLPHRPIQFYFDGISDGPNRLDIFGTLVAAPRGGLEVAIEAVQAVARDGQLGGYQSARWFRANPQLRPDEVLEIALPEMEEQAGQPFAKRTFSLRIRARLIR